MLAWNTFLSPSRRAAYQPRSEEHEEHTYRNISGPSSSPTVSSPRVPTLQPIRVLRARRDDVTARAYPRKYFPNSDKAPRCIIRCARPRAANKFLSNTTGIVLSSFRRVVTRDCRGFRGAFGARDTIHLYYSENNFKLVNFTKKTDIYLPLI